MQTAKLTLKLDKDVIEQTKAFARAHSTSLSQLVEKFFRSLYGDEATSQVRLTGVVGELAGILDGVKAEADGEQYADYLARKYS
jgi:hypothetical protein